MLTGLYCKISKKTAISHPISFKPSYVQVNKSAKAFQRRECIVEQCRINANASIIVIEVYNGQTESFLGREVICERSLRHVRGFSDIANSCAGISIGVHDSHAHV